VRTLGLTACFSLLLLATAAPAWSQEEERPLTPPVAVADDALTAALETGELTEAEYSLERARSLFQLGRVRREFGDVARASAHDATLILRDLAARVDDLDEGEQVAAERILARPASGGVPIKGSGWGNIAEAQASPQCTENVCVHWVDDQSSLDTPPREDRDHDGIPDWVDLTLDTWRDVWIEEIDTLEYRAPLSDESSPHGGTRELDVYLDDLGELGYFGYCTTDDPAAGDAEVFAVSAYCVIDDDFSQSQYGTAHTPQEFLEVTSAHEFHHASQYAYDWLEDEWLMEGTATNMEETVYPAINDNVNFLELWSPLSRPASPLDGSGYSSYGSWIFWRFLQEKVASGDPAILREIWERATLRDNYSLQAVQKEVAQRGLPLVDTFVRFGVANRLLNYADAKTAGYPATPSTDSWYLRPSRPATGWQSWRIDHLATRFFSFAPGAGVASDARLRLSLTLPRTGARAAVIVVNADGSRTTRYVTPNTSGGAVRVARFGRGAVARVHLVLSNGSPTGDNRRFGFKAGLVP
jgi:hypothetical protein